MKNFGRALPLPDYIERRRPLIINYSLFIIHFVRRKFDDPLFEKFSI